MAWSPNYCLNCDKQTYEQHYCSQHCRLADLEKSAYSAPVTPSLNHHSSLSSSTSRPTSSSSPYSSLSFSVITPTRSNVQVQLPPAFNFAAYRQGSSPSSSSSASYSPPSSPRSQHHMQSMPQQYLPRSAVPTLQRSSTDYPAKQQTLYTSASRSSLSSITSTSTNGVSDQALSELRKYSNAFDHFRDYKRRVTLT